MKRTIEEFTIGEIQERIEQLTRDIAMKDGTPKKHKRTLRAMYRLEIKNRLAQEGERFVEEAPDQAIKLRKATKKELEARRRRQG